VVGTTRPTRILRPDKLMSEWRGACWRLDGVTVRECCEVKGFVRDRGRAPVGGDRPWRDDGRCVSSSAAGGADAAAGRFLGCKVPIQPGKGYSITMARPARCPTIPLIFEEHRVAVTPMRSSYRLGSTMEFQAMTRR